eukprot:GHVP01015805.1.p1 GENE.GHVP01015805.1~~GHVP01015805.1.p1  ORF type:complete len:304 (+),score=22.50 GHVP01015805.1:53-964(+)
MLGLVMTHLIPEGLEQSFQYRLKFPLLLGCFFQINPGPILLLTAFSLNIFLHLVINHPSHSHHVHDSHSHLNGSLEDTEGGFSDYNPLQDHLLTSRKCSKCGALEMLGQKMLVGETGWSIGGSQCNLKLVNGTASSPTRSRAFDVEVQQTSSLKIQHHKASLLLTALSIHSLCEGMVIGSASKANVVMAVTIVLSLHKSVAGLILGVNMKLSKLSLNKSFIPFLCFSFSSPIGAILGFCALRIGSLPGTLASCISAGSILHISACEIVAAEFGEGTTRRPKKFFYFCGGLIASWVFSSIDYEN